MEEPKSTAGQGLGIAALVLGILAIPMGIFPCTFLVGILFGIIGIVLSLVALSQANRGYGPKGLIIAALICAIVGLSFASLWGFALSRSTDGARIVKEIFHNEDFRDFGRDDIIINDSQVDTTMQPGSDMEDMTDTLKALEGEENNQ